jgi:hypothetical protein
MFGQCWFCLFEINIEYGLLTFYKAFQFCEIIGCVFFCETYILTLLQTQRLTLNRMQLYASILTWLSNVSCENLSSDEVILSY